MQNRWHGTVHVILTAKWRSVQGCYSEVSVIRCKISEPTLRHRVAHDKICTSRQGIGTSCIHFSLIGSRFITTICWIRNNNWIIMFITSTCLLVRNTITLSTSAKLIYVHILLTLTKEDLCSCRCSTLPWVWIQNDPFTSLSIKILVTKSLCRTRCS